MSSRSLIILPDDSAAPILEAINQASSSLRIKMFVFSDPKLMERVIAAHQRGVKVQVMLNPARRSGEDDNADSRKQLLDAGVDVRDSSPHVELTHEKSMVVDDKVAFVFDNRLHHESANRRVFEIFLRSHAARRSGASTKSGYLWRPFRGARAGPRMTALPSYPKARQTLRPER